MCVPGASCADVENVAEGYDDVSLVRGVNESVGGVKQLACSLLHVPQFHGVIVINDAACVVQDGFAHPTLEGEWPVSSRC